MKRYYVFKFDVSLSDITVKLPFLKVWYNRGVTFFYKLCRFAERKITKMKDYLFPKCHLFNSMGKDARESKQISGSLFYSSTKMGGSSGGAPKQFTTHLCAAIVKAKWFFAKELGEAYSDSEERSLLDDLQNLLVSYENDPTELHVNSNDALNLPIWDLRKAVGKGFITILMIIDRRIFAIESRIT